jgi:hypothetical protein
LNRLRLTDWLIVAACIAFALTSFLVDPLSAFGVPVDGNSGCPVIHAVSGWALRTDPLWLDNPVMLRVQTGISVFVYGPFYLVLTLATIKQWRFIRTPALLFSGAMIVNVTVYVVAALIGYNVKEPVLFVAVNAPYLALPLGLIAKYGRPTTTAVSSN